MYFSIEHVLMKSPREEEEFLQKAMKRKEKGEKEEG